jgi:predicted ATPase
MLYRALTGMPAFPPAGVAVTWFSKMHLPPTAPNELLGGVPPDLSMLAMDLLHPDPLARPTGDTIAEMLAGGDTQSTSSAGRAVARTDLVGRMAERETLLGVLRRVRAGGAGLVHLRGPSGVGKSALLGDLRHAARLFGDAMVLRGRCYERESVPYKAFDGMFDELARRLAVLPAVDLDRILPRWIVELARVFPVLGSVPAIRERTRESFVTSSSVPIMELRRRALVAARELIASLARQQVVVLEIDDLQWADSDSIALLDALLGEPAPARLLVAASFRPHEASTSTATAAYLTAVPTFAERKDLELVTIDVGPLSEEEARDLAAATLSTHDDRAERLATAIAGESGGVPFFVEELARFANQEREQGREVSTSGVTLDSLLAQRLETLPAAERALVEVLAVANNPIPLSVSFAVAGIETGVLRALWTLRGGHFVRATGAGAADRVELHHDRMRESVLSALPIARAEEHRLALGRALAALGEGSPWLFDAVRHLNGVMHRLVGEERVAAARLNLAAGKEARRGAAFPLAFECYRAATLWLSGGGLGDDGWQTHYDLALAANDGAAEAAYLSASWSELDTFVRAVKTNGRTILDQIGAWEVEIDALIARNQYAEAVSRGVAALRLLHVSLPDDPGEAEVGAELGQTMKALGAIGPEGVTKLGVATDPAVVAEMRIESRISSAAYFAKPMLLPVLACRLVTRSVERGSSPATAYALAVYGIVLNSIGMLPEAHTWGQVALQLVERFDDRSYEARTRHIVHDLVCTWMVPLRSTLANLRAVVDIGKSTGDLEYAAYAAHAWTHNALYASAELGPLLDEALALGAFMRGQGQVNALHVHEPFEQLLKCLLGRSTSPATLDGDGFSEAEALARARAQGSRSAQCLLPFLMGMVRFHFGAMSDASRHFEMARPFLDGVASTWHHPMLHQHAALAIWSLPEAERAPLEASADASLASLGSLAQVAPANFAHRVALVEAMRAKARGDASLARTRFADAVKGAEAEQFWLDVGLAHALWAAMEAESEHRAAANAAYARCGAKALVR